MSNSINVSIEKNNLNTFIPKFIKFTINKLSDEFNVKIQAKTPKRTGDTADKWQKESISDYEAKVTNDSKVIVFLNDGTGIYGKKKHRIVPVNAKALRWVDNGKVIFAKSTKGQKAQKFIKPTLKETVSKLPSIVNVNVM